ncbi:MAG: hypothetical protein ACK2U2_13650 [Anaerolineae bacterium]
MTNMPIKRVTLYKHGVGFFERRATVSGEHVDLSFRVEEMNDILKSLTVIDWSGGHVRGVDYATPLSDEEKLAGCSIRLGDRRSLRDLLVRLRGRRVRLILDQGEEPAGTLLGLDELPERQQVSSSLVSVLLDGSDRVQTFTLERLEGVEILDERGAGDLRFFLETALSQEDYRQLTIRLSPGDHDLSAAYIAPAPTWRVSYRLVASEGEGGTELPALLQGWGLFDNRLDEDLEAVALTLVAGMPISFVYDLYKPFMPERPVVEEEARVAAAPVEFAEADRAMLMADMTPPRVAARRRPDAERADLPQLDMPAYLSKRVAEGAEPGAIRSQALKEAAPAEAEGEELGELFQYVIGTPVTVRRGHSAMVPIVSSELNYRKELLYNGSKMPMHPVATLFLKNDTGLTLERGPLTVIHGGAYVGEAVLPLTARGGELVVPYAVELGIQVREEYGSAREIRGLEIKEAYLHVEEWAIRWREYRLHNSTEQPMTVLVEHPHSAHLELYDTPEPKERTQDHLRFDVEVPAHGETTLRVRERRLLSRQEQLQKQSYEGLRRYLEQELLDREAYETVTELLGLWERIAGSEKRVQEIDRERQKIYQAQQQIQGNMGALSATGKEGALRTRYVEQLEATEDQLRSLAQQEAEFKAVIQRLNDQIGEHLAALG